MTTTTRVPFVDLTRQHEPIRAELGEAFDRVVGASAFILGEEVARFEEEFATYCGVAHCIGVASGTAALSLTFGAMGIGPGDEVIVPAHTFIASALGVVHAGATPVLCDVHRGTGLIDAESASSVVTDRTAAVLAVHLYGQVADMVAVTRLADRHGLAVVEDAAQAHGATDQGRPAGSLGRAGAFSFYPSKNLGALGDAGAICTGDDQLAEKARMLRNLGQRRKADHAILGYNERLDGLQAAVLRTKLRSLDGWNAARRARAREYRDALDGTVELLEERAGAESVYHLFPVRLEDRDGLKRRLTAAGIQTGVHYTPALDGHAGLTASLPRREGFPEATAWARRELSLPMFESLRSEEVAQVVEACAAG